MTEYTQKARLDELIAQLNASDRYIDLDLMAEIMDQGDASVDRLIAVVETSDDWAGIHALLMLVEMRAEKALPAISQALLKDPDLNEWIDREGLSNFGPAAIDTLETMIKDKSADWYARATAGNGLVAVAARYPETYVRVTSILRSLLPSPDINLETTDEDPDIWASTISDLAQLRDPEAYELIGRLFDAHLVDPAWMDRESYENLYRSDDPHYGVDPKPTDLLSSHRAMQESWRRSEQREKPAPRPSSPPRRKADSQRKSKRKSQRAARKQQRKRKKKKR